MKAIEILAHTSGALRQHAERHAHELGAARTVRRRIRLFEEGDTFVRFADEWTPRWTRRRLILMERLNHDELVQNLAERLVVAVRIQNANRPAVRQVAAEQNLRARLRST